MHQKRFVPLLLRAIKYKLNKAFSNNVRFTRHSLVLLENLGLSPLSTSLCYPNSKINFLKPVIFTVTTHNFPLDT